VEETGPLLPGLVVLVGLAAAGVAIFERLRLPAIAGFLVTGALLGPGGLGLVDDPAAVRELAAFGVVFLLFEIGLELPLDRLRKTWTVAVAAGALQVGMTMAAAALGARLFGIPGRSAIVLGALVAMSSTALVIRLLGERGEIDAPHGQLGVGILLFQDLCIVPFLLAVPLLAAGSLSPAPILGAAVRAVLALAVFYAVARFALPWVLARVARLRSRDLFSLVAVLIVLGAAVAAERMGLTLAVGAFLAGLAVTSSPWGPQLSAEVLPLRGVLLGVFFTAVGMLLDLRVAVEEAPVVALFALADIPLKALVVFGVLAGALRQGSRLALLAALALAQTGEFSFVLAEVAGEAGLLEPRLAQAFIAGSVLSLLATPFLVRAGPSLVRYLPDFGGPTTRVPESGHVVLVGFGFAGRSVARVLRALGLPYVAVEANARVVAEAQAAGDRVVFGDATRSALLEHVGVARARAVVVAITDPLATRHVVGVARTLHPGVPILARTRYVLEVDPLAEAGASSVIADEVEGSLLLLAELLRGFGVGAGAIERFVGELREEGYELLRGPLEIGIDPWLLELLEQVSTEWLEVPASFRGEPTLVDLAFRPRTGASVLAIDHGGDTTPNPPPSTPVRAGDRLLVFGSPAALARARACLAQGPGED
jgi:CPA2 family monovalent cation:H+ antiporter-2